MMTFETLTSYQEHDLKRAFAWLTKSKIGPAFGSRPIGWYQAHQCKAIDALCNAAKTAGVYQPEYALTVSSTAFGNRGVYVLPCNKDGRTNGLAPTYLGDVSHFFRVADSEARK